MFALVLASMLGGTLTTVGLWSWSWPVAILSAPLGGSLAAGIAAALVAYGRRGAMAVDIDAAADQMVADLRSLTREGPGRMEAPRVADALGEPAVRQSRTVQGRR